jgi:single-strand DNA-binding protein
MAGSVNKVILVGNLGKDPEVRSFPNGGRVANFSIATSESWKDKATGERKEKTQWHNIAVKNDALVGICEKYLRKGSKVFLEGQLETRKYEKDGRDVYITEVVLAPYRGELTMLDGKNNSGSGAANDYAEEPVALAAAGGNHGSGSGAASGGSFGASGKNDMDDDIPF